MKNFLTFCLLAALLAALAAGLAGCGRSALRESAQQESGQLEQQAQMPASRGPDGPPKVSAPTLPEPN